MSLPAHSTVVGIFDDRENARKAVNELRDLGFREDQIGVAARYAENIETATVTGETASATAEKSKWEEGAATGAVAGAGIGALWALGIAANMLPAIGPVIAGGLLASILASAAGGAAVAGVAGALIGLGVPEDEAKRYEQAFTKGRTIVTVYAPGRYEEARDVLHRFKGYDIHSGDLESDLVTKSGTM